MKLRVQRRDGRIETINVVGPMDIHHGDHLNHCHSADGLDHYFTLDGYYDGWGATARPGARTLMDAVEVIDRVESERAIEEPPA